MRPDALSQYDDEPEPEPEPVIESSKDSSSWDEDACVICSVKCHTFKSAGSNGLRKSSGQVSAEELLTLMDTALEDPPENVMLCGACSFRVGKLQGIHDELTRIQQIFLDLQKEIASKIVGGLGKNEDDVRISLLKRWRDADREPMGTSNDSNESDEFRLVDFQSKIPKDLIISPAIEGVDEVKEEVEEDHHEVEFHLDPRLFQVVEESGDKMEDGDENMHDVECIDVDDDSDEEDGEVDAASLIPAIEISGFDDQPVEVQEMNPVITATRSQQPNIYFSTNGTVFTSDLDSLYPPDSPTEQDSNEQASYSDSTESSKTNGRVARTTTYRSPRVRARSTNGFGKHKTPVFSCTVCTDTFRSREKFKEHLETHNGKAPTCEVCQKVFPRKHNLIIHMRTHTGEKPYNCPVCKKPYSDRSNFNAHVRKHMAKPFGCTICNRMFETSAAAHSHATSVHPEQAAGKIISKVTFKSREQV